MVIRYYKTMSENFSTKDAKTKIENLLSLSEAYVKQLPRTDFQANPVFFQTNEATKTETDKNQFKSQSSLNFQKNDRFHQMYFPLLLYPLARVCYG